MTKPSQPKPIPAAEVQKKFGFYQDEAIRAPVLISKNGRPKTVLLSYDEFLRLRRRDRQAYAMDELPEAVASAILEAKVPDDLEDPQT
jgi:prevent-host-death family protein